MEMSAFHKSLVEKKIKRIRWALGSIFIKGKILKHIQKKNIKRY